MRKLTILLCGLMLIFGVAAVANAVPISGEMLLGWYKLDPTFDAGTATVLPSMTGFVGYASDDLQPLQWTFLTTNAFAFNPATTPVAAPLWTAGGFSFTLDSVYVTVQTGSQLGLAGMGTLSSVIPGLDDTIYAWGINITDLWCGFSFSQSTAPVPEPATMLLLGTALAGFAAVGRRRSGKKA